MDKPVWNVYREDDHSDIKTFNIFDHGYFWDMCNIIWVNVHDHHPQDTEALEAQVKEFKESIVKELFYYFWSKVEWEICLTSVFEDNRKYQKIDAYSQVSLNIDAFIDYLWNWFTLNKEINKYEGAGWLMFKKK